MKIDPKDFRVQEGIEIDLDKWPTNVAKVYRSKADYHEMLDDRVGRLSAQQELLYASNRHAVLIIFQAMDAAGKDGAIKHVMSGVNPQGCQVFSFKHPSGEELQHDFLWRTTRDLPERGRIGIFNRSYYEEVLIVRVHPRASSQRGTCRTGRPTKESSGRPVSFHRGSGTSSARQRHPDHQVLPASLKGGAAEAFPATDRRAGEELEVQPGGYRGAGILEAIHEGL